MCNGSRKTRKITRTAAAELTPVHDNIEVLFGPQITHTWLKAAESNPLLSQGLIFIFI